MPSLHRARYSRLQLSPPGSNFLRGPIRQPEVARYREVALASFAVNFVLGFCYWVQPPVEDARSIWEWSWRYPTGFSLNALLTTLYILAVQVRQIVFIVGLWLDPMEQIDTAIIMMPHVISFNILHTVWAMAFGHGYFIIATLVLVINFANCAAGYFRHYRNCPIRELRWGLVSGPWAFNMIAILWTGALIFPEGATRVLRLVYNLVIWVILFVGMGFLAVFHDYNMGFSLSFLMVSMALCQIFTKIVALQWLFATIISIVLFVCSCIIASTILFDRAFIVTLGNESTNEERMSLVNSVLLPSQTFPTPPFEPQHARI